MRHEYPDMGKETLLRWVEATGDKAALYAVRAILEDLEHNRTEVQQLTAKLEALKAVSVGPHCCRCESVMECAKCIDTEAQLCAHEWVERAEQGLGPQCRKCFKKQPPPENM